jgi:hypothetical protein
LYYSYTRSECPQSINGAGSAFVPLAGCVGTWPAAILVAAKRVNAFRAVVRQRANDGHFAE